MPPKIDGADGELSAQRSDLSKPLSVGGFLVYQEFLDVKAQAELMAEVESIWTAAPPVRPVTRWGKQMSVAMSSAGDLGWTTDRRGYRYEAHQPDGSGWPPIPDPLLHLWRTVTALDVLPDSCLVNLYQGNAKMGLHQDRDEADMRFPVVSVSLGDEALFRIGGTERTDSTQSIWLRSGDVVVMGGPARLAYHGIDRIRVGSSTLVPQGGRVNLTLRVAGPQPSAPQTS